MKKLVKIVLTAVGAYLGISMFAAYLGLVLKSMKELRQEQNGEISVPEYAIRTVKDIKEGYRYFASDDRPRF